MVYNKNMSNPNFRPVEESAYGLYVWRMPDGRFVGDDEGNFLNVPAKKHDIKQIAKLREAVKYYGIEEGEPAFLSGRRRITESEHEEQHERLDAGLTPDKYDVGAMMDALREKKQNG